MLSRQQVLDRTDATWGAAAHAGSLDRCAVEASLRHVAVLRRWLDGVDTTLLQRLRHLDVPDPDGIAAQVERISRRDAKRALRRAEIVDDIPEAAGALLAGQIAAGHVDALGAVLARVDPTVRDQLVATSHELINVARSTTPDEFRQHLQRQVRHLESDDGQARLDRQQQQVALKAFTHADSGMIHLDGRYDPETGLALTGTIDAEVERRFHTGTPPNCPTDPSAKQDFLRAHALLGLLGIPSCTVPDQPGHPREPDDPDEPGEPAEPGEPGDGRPGPGGSGRPSSPSPRRGGSGPRAEIIIVIDEHTLRHGPHPATIIDPGGPPGIDIPLSAIRRWITNPTTALVHVTLGTDGVVHHVSTGGSLHLGRTTRLANRAQRRALRAMYPTCAIPGCTTGYERCAPHHVHWWEHGGPTDIENLLPLCTVHHHAVHDGGWHLHLALDRTLTITKPDGTIMRTGPPRRRSA